MDPHPFAWKIPTPPGGLLTPKLIVVFFACLMSWSQTLRLEPFCRCTAQTSAMWPFFVLTQVFRWQQVVEASLHNMGRSPIRRLCQSYARLTDSLLTIIQQFSPLLSGVCILYTIQAGTSTFQIPGDFLMYSYLNLKSLTKHIFHISVFVSVTN